MNNNESLLENKSIRIRGRKGRINYQILLQGIKERNCASVVDT